MNRKNLLIFSFLLANNIFIAQSDSLLTLDHYFEIVDSIEFEEMKRVGVITKEDSIADQYLDKSTGRLNDDGFLKYAEIKQDVYFKFYSDYLLLQSVHFKDDVYLLYFSIAGFDDIEFQIIKCKHHDWQGSYKLNKSIIGEPNQKFQEIAFNYDEGPKNIENVKIFIRNDYLVMERSGLYHSLYDLRSNELLVNDESPWHSSNADNLETMNRWIKDNIHSKIEEKLNSSR